MFKGMSHQWLSEYLFDFGPQQSRVRTIPRQGEIVKGVLHAFHVRFESWVDFQNEYLRTINMYLTFLVPRPDSNQRSHPLQEESLPSALLMFNIYRLKTELFVCKYLTYFQSLIYFRTELLTRVKFSRHIETGFCGPTSTKSRICSPE